MNESSDATLAAQGEPQRQPLALWQTEHFLIRSAVWQVEMGKDSDTVKKVPPRRKQNQNAARQVTKGKYTVPSVETLFVC